MGSPRGHGGNHRLSPIGLLDRYTVWCLRMPEAKGLAFSLLPLLAIVVLMVGLIVAEGALNEALS